MTNEEVKTSFPENWESSENSVGYCYVTYRTDTGEIYIGKKQSKTFLNTYYGSGTAVIYWKTQKCVLKHWPISWAQTKQELLDQEHVWVAKAKDVAGKDCANMRPGGASAMVGKKHSPETIQKMRESARRVKHAPMSQKTKDKISAANKGKHSKTAEQRAVVGDFHRGRKRSEETCRRIGQSKSGENNPNFGKPRSEKTKRKISEAQKGRPFTPEHREKLRQSRLRYLAKTKGGQNNGEK